MIKSSITYNPAVSSLVIFVKESIKLIFDYKGSRRHNRFGNLSLKKPIEIMRIDIVYDFLLKSSASYKSRDIRVQNGQHGIL